MPEPEAEPVSGLLVVDKAGGMTSHDVVARIRRLAGTRKVGHAGTLDPMATGVLVVGVNRATRLLGHLMVTEKAYDATIRLGESTTTDDADGESLQRATTRGVTDAAILAALRTLEGEIDQVPSAVS
ncbi:MAG: tRNA pseudouridine(55) synthase TruB, partial [Nocardioidaceae bacterium]|nr:tRNA pseudouridine(55) synthase TruB [Nocardioidaceae bacterium]